jgi:hypothetical protein
MADHAEKTIRPDFKADDQKIRLSDDDEGRLDLPQVVQTAEPIKQPECAAEGHAPTANGNQASSIVKAKDHLKTASSGVESTENARPSDTSQPSLGVKQTPAPDHGLLRHRLVIAGCLGVAAVILGLSTIDLRPLIKRNATIDRSFRIAFEQERPELPANLTYQATAPYAERGVPSDNGLESVKESEPDSSGDRTGLVDRIGFVDASGKLVIKPEFSDAGTFHEGLAAAKQSGEGNTKWGYIDTTGKWVIAPKYSEVSPFIDGAAAVKGDTYSGLIDRTGHILNETTNVRGRHVPITSRFEGADTFPKYLGPFYVVAHDFGYGLMDSSGHWLLNPEFDGIESFSAYDDDDLSDTIIQPWWVNTGADGKFFAIKKGSRYGVVDSAGKIIIPPQFDGIASFRNGHATIKVGKKYGFADSSGKIVIAPQFDFATPFAKVIAVKQQQKWHFIDSQGKRLPAPEVDGIIFNGFGDWLSEGLGAIVDKNLCGFVDSNGRLAITPRFQFEQGFNEGYAPVWDGTYWRFIDKQGNYSSPEKFGSASSFFKGKAAVDLPGPLYTLADSRSIANANRHFEWLKSHLFFEHENRDVRPSHYE